MRTADLPDARPTESATERGVDQHDGISYHPVIRGLTTLGGAVQDFLVHARGDSVGVAVKDLSAGAQVQGRYHEGDAGAGPRLGCGERRPAGAAHSASSVGVPASSQRTRSASGEAVNTRSAASRPWRKCFHPS